MSSFQSETGRIARQYWAFILKEWFHISRDRKTLLILIGLPVIQIILFGFALTNEVRNINIVYCDMAHNAASGRLAAKIDASSIFNLVGHAVHPDKADQMLRSGKAHGVIVVPEDFGSGQWQVAPPRFQILTDGSDPNLSTTIQFYLEAISQDALTANQGSPSVLQRIQIQTRMLYNPQLKGAYTFVPGVMAMVLMIICTLMTSVSIVREKELGNMEMLLVSPMNPLIVLFSKTIPYLILSLIIVTIILILSVTILNVPIRGNILLLYLVCFVFIITCLSFGLAISTITSSQQVAMLISLMGLMLPTIMFGGFMFPIENMPIVLQVLSNVVPAKWFYYSINDIMIKGLGLSHVIHRMGILLIYILVFMGISYRKFNIRLS